MADGKSNNTSCNYVHFKRLVVCDESPLVLLLVFLDNNLQITHNVQKVGTTTGRFTRNFDDIIIPQDYSKKNQQGIEISPKFRKLFC